MELHLELGSTRVCEVVWPGTHDSATDKIGIPYATRPFAQCQTLPVYQQLLLGVRALDVRVDHDGFICHGILSSYRADVVTSAVRRFLLETTSEFVLLDVRTEYGHEDPPGFDAWLEDELGEYLIPDDESVLGCTLAELLPRRVICFWRPRKPPAPAPASLLWSAPCIRDNWTDTDLPYTKFRNNMNYLALQAPADARSYFYRVENTCTPQADSAVSCVRPITSRIQPFARLFISQAFKSGLGDRLQIFSSDFIDADFVDACIGFTLARLSCRRPPA
jgi:hypothetical protein